MRVFFDHNVPDSAAGAFLARGHDVIFLRDWLPPDSPDQLVAATAEVNNAVLVTYDGDFNKISSRIPKGYKRRFKNLSRITLGCPEPNARLRLSKGMSFIELEYDIAQKTKDPRMIIFIGKEIFRTHR